MAQAVICTRGSAGDRYFSDEWRITTRRHRNTTCVLAIGNDLGDLELATVRMIISTMNEFTWLINTACLVGRDGYGNFRWAISL